MTYQKITMAASPCKEAPMAVSVSQRVHNHRPEIVFTQNKQEHSTDILKRRSNRIYIPATVKCMVVAVLCAASFILGCSVTDSKISKAIIGISKATFGNIQNDMVGDSEITDASQDSTYFYKYKQQNEQDFSGIAPIEYASDKYTTGDNQSQQQSVPASSFAEMPAQADEQLLYPVMAVDISTDNVHSLSNETKYLPDTYSLASKTPSALKNIDLSSGEPIVLILHTHATESYNELGDMGYYNPQSPTRSEDITKNVVGIGSKVAEILNGFGISTIHSQTLCDKESFVNAYSTSAKEAQWYLDKYPSIRLVIDLHRDSITSTDLSKKKPVFDELGKSTAQLMFVVGTDAAGAKHTDWRDNLSLALKIQSDISNSYPDLFRRINLRNASFNQQLSVGSLLLECGSCANTYEEAERAAEIFATELARVIKKEAL